MVKSLVKKPVVAGVSAAVCIALFFLFPFALKLKLALCLSLLVLALWATSAVDTTVSSVFYLFATLALGLAPAKTIFHFPLTQNFYLILLSYLLTEGVIQSGVAGLFAQKVMAKVATTPVRLVFFSYLAGLLLVFFIPQPFPRVILLAAFYRTFFAGQQLPEKSKQVLYFSIFTASTFTAMFFLNGDTLLNFVVVELSGATIGWGEWALYMSVPSLVICVATFFLFLLVFRKELKGVAFQKAEAAPGRKPLDGRQRRVLAACTIIFVGFLTQDLHHLPAAVVMLIGLPFAFTGPRSLLRVNWKLLIFLTASFSIGGVLGATGAAELLVQGMAKLMPSGNRLLQLTMVIVIVVALNFVLGSAVTTVSVVLPTVAQLGVFPPQSVVLALFIYTVVNMKYLLPFHHGTILVGAGEGLFPNSMVVKYGLVLTLLTFIVVLFVCMPWWQLMGLC
ncbi:MAG: SLC13 family permease [Candidatus Limiplasma sp.]|nr:SLC13 family permease [Candidatus Limiplasma sp.]